MKNQKTDIFVIRNQKPESRNQKLEIRNPEIRNQKSQTRNRKSEIENQKPETRIGNLKSEIRNPKPLVIRREWRGWGVGRGSEGRVLVMQCFSNSRTSFFGSGVGGGGVVWDLLEVR